MKAYCLRNNRKHNIKPGHFPPGFALWRINNYWQRFAKSKLETLDLTLVQFGLLKGIKHCDDECEVTQVELAESCEMNVMMTSQVLRTLEKKNLIQRIPHSTDTRAKVIILTIEGEQLLNKAITVMQNATEEFFAPIKSDLKPFTAILYKLLKNYE